VIPKIIHQFWLNPEPIPERLQRCRQSVLDLNPDFDCRLHTDESILDHPDLGALGSELKAFYSDVLGNCYRPKAVQCDLLKFATVYVYGGIALDLDMFATQPLGDKFLEDRIILGKCIDEPSLIAEAIFGTAPHSSEALHTLRAFLTRRCNEDGIISINLAGLSRNCLWRKYPTEYFCPHWKGDGEEKWYRYTPNTHFIHLWNHNDYNWRKLRAIQKAMRKT
jgi:hypothetical protein